MIKDSNISIKDIDILLDKFTINEIECASVQLFLNQNNLSISKNKLISQYLTNNKNIDDIIDYLNNLQPDFNLKAVERIFELLIPKSDRETNGAFYTPSFVIKYIVDNSIFGDETVCDPSCGSGGFLLEATKKIQKLTKKSIIEILENNIFGCDILDYSVRRSKILLTLYAIYNSEDVEEINFNIMHDDSLLCNWHDLFPEILGSKGIYATKEDIDKGFDVIVGNPPYLRIQDLDEEVKDNLLKKWKNVNKGNFNIYFTFYYLGIELLKKEGKLGYITPNNFFTSLAGKKLREWMIDKINVIIDFKHLQLFEDVTTYTCIVLLSNSVNDSFRYKSIESEEDIGTINEDNLSLIKINDLNSKKWRLLNSEDQENIRKIENCGTKLGEITSIKTGIATLKDKLYFVDTTKEDEKYYYKEFNEIEYPIEKEITRNVIKISTVKTEEDIKNNPLKIIYPYKNSSKLEIIAEEDLKNIYPKCYGYLLTIKDELATRDKGKKKYETWYAYGRKQGLNSSGIRLLTPTFSKEPRFLLDCDENALFCNGYGVFEKDLDIKIIQKIINSIVMDYYINKTSVNIEGGFPCFQKNFIELFTIPELDKKDLDFLSKEIDKEKINNFLIKKYDLDKEVILNFKHV